GQEGCGQVVSGFHRGSRRSSGTRRVEVRHGGWAATQLPPFLSGQFSGSVAGAPGVCDFSCFSNLCLGADAACAGAEAAWLKDATANDDNRRAMSGFFMMAMKQRMRIGARPARR